ncbi:MAG TPA: NrfD/PsrC family molybdoenzyme membrane anchor subunit [Dehalococcoidia bacterium]|nr:NrfD/PsrC family molybdoenzyme membrane anchor subunit [Dehalococcoidia bacterium]
MRDKHSAMIGDDLVGSSDTLVARSVRGVARQVDWAWLVALYMGFSSAGAGAYVVWQVAGMLEPSWVVAGRAGAAVAIALVILGASLILLDLGRWSHFYRAASRPRASWESRGFLAILAIILLGCLQIGAWVLDLASWDRLLSVPITVLALALLPYGAFLLKEMRAYALWTSPLQMALVPTSGLLAGCAVLAIDPFGTLSNVHYQSLGTTLVVLAVLKALLLVALLWQTRTASRAGRVSTQTLLSGALARLFWAGAIGLGLILPFFVALAVWSGLLEASVMRLAGVSALVGYLVLRYGVLAAAHRPSELTFRDSGPWGISR